MVELYCALRKKTRETLAIDELLKNPAAPVPAPSRSKVFMNVINKRLTQRLTRMARTRPILRSRPLDQINQTIHFGLSEYSNLFQPAIYSRSAQIQSLSKLRRRATSA